MDAVSTSLFLDPMKQYSMSVISDEVSRGVEYFSCSALKEIPAGLSKKVNREIRIALLEADGRLKGFFFKIHQRWI
jgi:hypothetical protein